MPTALESKNTYTPNAVGGAVDFFIKIAKIEGEATDAKHAKEIDVLSWSWGASQSGTFAQAGGGGAGKVNMSDLSFTCYQSKASPKLIQACARGEHLTDATLTARKAGGGQQDYFTIKLTDVLVSSYSIGASSERPTESVTLNFAKIEVEYKPQKADGGLDSPVKFGYDLTKNEKL
jgi:type VI secretion system secreted protein Hcp